jgi:hypothetical protein
MTRDPIVEDVRTIREELASRFGFDLRRIIDDARTRRATSASRIVSFEVAGQAPTASGDGRRVSPDPEPNINVPTVER